MTEHNVQPGVGAFEQIVPEVFGGLVTFADVKDLEPGHEA
jgi:hypothetical protein